MTRPAAGLRIRSLYALFFVSGFCGLIYESLWSHYLKLIVGHAAYAQAVVLVVFVGGMALGAWLTGRVSEKLAHPLILYAVVEALVALVAFGFHGVFVRVSDWSAGQLLPAVCAPGEPCHAMWGVAAMLILLPSVLLGTTFPLMCAGVMRLGVAPGRGLGLLYFLNSAGAVLGVLGSGFVFIPRFGLQGTLLLAGALNAAVAVAAYGAARAGAAGQAPGAPARGAQAHAAVLPWLAVAAVTGLSSFIYEVAWIRMLTLVLGAATHSFELMLASFILGLALGGWWIRNRIDRMRRPQLALAGIQVLMGLLALATLPLYLGTFDAMALALRALARTEEGYALFGLASGLLAAAVMLPAAICAGMTLPLVTAILLKRGGGERQIGQVYAFNTFGAIAGVLLAVHGLIPVLGLKGSLAVGAFIDILLGAGILLWARREGAAGWDRRRSMRAWAGVGAAAAAGLGLALLTPFGAQQLASGVFRSGQARLPADWQVRLHQDGKTATITVVEQPSGVRVLMTNGKPDGSSHPHKRSVTPDDPTVTLLGALGLAHHPTARHAAVIGLGTGITSAVLLESPAIQTLETIEIEPVMLQAAQWFRPRNQAAFDDPRSRLVVDDARAHFAKSRRQYDLIVSEPSNPWVSGVSGLFTAQFYQRVSGQLAPGGHFVQWLHVYQASPQLVDSVTQAFASAFPRFTAYAANPGDILLVARKDGQPAVLAEGALDAMPGLRARLTDVGITSAHLLAAHEVGRADAILALAGLHGAPPNSDYFPYVDNRAFRDRFLGQSAVAVFDLRLAPVPVLDFIQGMPSYLGQVQSAAATMPRHVIAMARAWHAQRYLAGDGAGAVAFESGPGAADHALVRGAIAQCRFPATGDPAWQSLVQVASDSSLGLSAQAAQALWQPALTGRCAQALSPSQAAWIGLFAAVGARDARQTQRRADEVLALDAQMPAPSREYALLAAVAARLALGEQAQARELLARQAPALPPQRRATPWFRYLAVLASPRG